MISVAVLLLWLSSGLALEEEQPDGSAHRHLAQNCPRGWSKASGTIYDSWPKPGSTECVDYDGCKWAGQFNSLDGGSKQCCCKNGAKWLDGGNGQYACRFPESLVKQFKMAATWNEDASLLGKKLKVKIAGKSKAVNVNVLDVCKDADCDGCCSDNASNGKYKLLDLEAQVACGLLGCNYASPNFDVNNLSYPVNKRPRANRDTMPLCYKVIGPADSF